jgi:hypothetical protein
MNQGDYILLVVMLVVLTLLITTIVWATRSPRSIKKASRSQLISAAAPPTQREPTTSPMGCGGWVILWVILAGMMSVSYLNSSSGGGCDGGLCILRYVFLPVVWLSVGLGLGILRLIVDFLSRQ